MFFNFLQIISTSTMCKEGYQLDDKSQCIPCLSAYCHEDVQEICPGVICKNGFVELCNQFQKIVNNECIICQGNVLCDGVIERPCYEYALCKDGELMRCKLGLQILQQSCQICGDGQFCDGSGQYECTTVPEAIRCKNGVVDVCAAHFVANFDRSGCVEKISACDALCVSMAVVFSIIVCACLVILAILLYNKKKKLLQLEKEYNDERGAFLEKLEANID